MAVQLLVALVAVSSLRLSLFNNTALAPPSATEREIDGLSLVIPGKLPLTAEIIGTFNPSNTFESGGSFNCTFDKVDIGFVWIDGHCVCQTGAYNNSARGIMDGNDFALLSKKSGLVVQAHLYHLKPSNESVRFSAQYCPPSKASTKCNPIPAGQLSPSLPPSEVTRRELQRNMSTGWGSWLHRDVLSVALLPDSAILTVMLCSLSTGHCLREAQIDQNGGNNGKTPIRVGSHAIDHRYSQLYAWYDSLLSVGPPALNVSIEYRVGPKDGKGGEREIDLLVTPVDKSTQNESIDLSEFAVVFAGRYTLIPSSRTLSLIHSLSYPLPSYTKSECGLSFIRRSRGGCWPPLATTYATAARSCTSTIAATRTTRRQIRTTKGALQSGLFWIRPG
jgi:hypothetical protein